MEAPWKHHLKTKIFPKVIFQNKTEVSTDEHAKCNCNGVFPKWIRTFVEFIEFRESNKSLKHELGSI